MIWQLLVCSDSIATNEAGVCEVGRNAEAETNLVARLPNPMFLMVTWTSKVTAFPTHDSNTAWRPISQTPM